MTILKSKYILTYLFHDQFDVFRKHFLPPLVVNAILGTVLWTAYGAAYSVIEPNLHNKPLTSAALSGGMAGGIQALVAAPVENVRFVIEGGAVGQSWLQAWKSMMSDSAWISPQAHRVQVKEARAFRNWMRDVQDLAGRGWSGWGWGFAKDICGEWYRVLSQVSTL